MSPRKRALAVLGVAVAVSLFATSALAGHGTVTDILSAQNVYLPNEPVCAPLARELTKVTDQTLDRGYPLKVAIIASPDDISGASQYFDRPQDYARLLGSQIGFYRPGDPVQSNDSLLVVMPAGFGLVRSGKAPNVFLEVFALERPEGGGANDLARAAARAVPQLADAAGHPVPEVSTECSGGGPSVFVYVTAIALGLLAAAAIAVFARRRAKGGRSGGATPSQT
jgi:hypothetical protein